MCDKSDKIKTKRKGFNMITERQKQLFDELRKMNPDIIDDGVPDEAAYLSADYRLMYVLKEVNGGSGWSLCEHLISGAVNRHMMQLGIILRDGQREYSVCQKGFRGLN